MVVGIVAAMAPVFRSILDMVLSPQFGTHRLPNPAASPEQGCLPAPSAIVAPTVFVFGSRRDTLSFGSFETQADSSTASQSGWPPVSQTASGLRPSIAIF